MSETSKCNRCGAPLPPDSPEGLCPRCLIALNLATQTEMAGETGPAKPPPSPPLPVTDVAKLFPQLEILECLGRGGMGAVYKARQSRLDRLVALKIISPEKQGNQKFAERFEREARALARLHHPNIVTVYDFGEIQGNFYLLMEFVDGLTLRQLLQARKLSPAEALAIVPKICEALQYAHEQGIVHRDIKPENILMDKEGRVKIADFGIAKIVGDSASSKLTAEQVIGTPHYMSPEQIEHPQAVDHRADIYSLGVVFYEMLTGELPLGKFQPPSQKVHIDVRLDEIVLRALEKEPERRYQQASEVKTCVENLSQSPPVVGPAPDTASFIQTALARDYSLNISHCLNRGWNLVISDFWRIVGVSALIWLLSSLATTSVLGIIIRYPLIGGLWLYFLNRIRGQTATLETAFSGFKVAFLQTVLVGLIVKILTALGLICLILPGIYLWVAWTFALALVVDKRLDFWPAMGLSRKIISRRWWKFFWFLIVLGLFHLAGLMLCYVGVFVAMPLSLAALAYAYEDIFGPVAGPASNIPAAVPVAPARSGGGWGTVAGVAVGVAAAVLFIAFIGLLAGVAIPNFVKGRQHALGLYQRQLAVKSDYIGQTWFPLGDSIEITSVERTTNQMTVKGRYSLVSHDSASLALHITASHSGLTPVDVAQEMKISKGSGDFELTHPRVVPGLPHVSMYCSNGHPFATVYFGTKDEAAQESAADWLTNSPPVLVYTNHPQVVSVWPPDGATNVDPQQELRIRFSQPMNPNDLQIMWHPGGFLSCDQSRYDPEQNEFIIPMQLLPGTTNKLELGWAGEGFHDTNGNPADDFNWQFTTKPIAPKNGAVTPQVVQISPPDGQTLAVLTLLQVTFDQPMTLARGYPYLRHSVSAFNLPNIISDISLDPSGKTVTIPLVLPPDNETKLILDGFRNADGVASEPVAVRCEISTNNYSSDQLSDILTAAKDPRLKQLLASMKAARAHYTSGIETIQDFSLNGEKGAFSSLRANSAIFKWQRTNQFYEDISDIMNARSFILGTDGKTCWLYYSGNGADGPYLNSSPVASVADISTSVADTFLLSRRTPDSAIAKGKLIYEGQCQLDGHTCYRVGTWFVEQTGDDYFPVQAGEYIWWIDAGTYLPVQLVQYALYGRETYQFHFDKLNQPLPDTTFQPPVEPGTSVPPEDWYQKKLGRDETRFMTIKDACNGSMSGRMGRQGPNGSEDSGLN